MNKTRASAQPMAKSHNGDQERSLSDELTQLNDDFVEFSEINAFLCHAFASALSDHEWLNTDAIDGARRCATWLQSRTGELKEDFRHVHARYTAELEEKPLTK
ncbi:MAG: hypothetical protein Q8O19_05765 [Rectinemataceae bacterium]|nr:hypothetical protein [Rectinemataceae bacterium]